MQNVNEFANTLPVAQAVASQVVAGGCSDIGLVRDQNEDAFLIAHIECGITVQGTNLDDLQPAATRSDDTLLVVADGMGGEGSGDVASRIAVQSVLSTLEHHLHRAPPPVSRVSRHRAPEESLDGVRKLLRRAVATGAARITDAAKHPEYSSTMGTTLTLAYLRLPWLYIAHAGDSRCYLLRSGQLSQLTRDHTLAQQFGEAGRAVPDGYADALFNALGAGLGGVDTELCKLSLQPDDVLLLCSDGLTRELTQDELARELSRQKATSELAAHLVALANERGGHDNITAVVARVS